MIKISGLEHLTASEQPISTWKTTRCTRRKAQKQAEGCSDYFKHLKTPRQVLDACRTWLRRARGLVRPGAAGLLTGVECSRTTRIGVELAAVQRKLPDRAEVGLQLYSARTFHVTLFPGYIRADRNPLETHLHQRQYKSPHRM